MSTIESPSFNLSFISNTAPSYINLMSSYQVVSLASTANGFTTVNSVVPSEWSTEIANVQAYSGVSIDGPYTGIINGWCGGGKPTEGTKLYLHGGGHQSTGNNGMYVFDFSGTTQPTGWSCPKISPRSAVVDGSYANANGGVYSDGLPSSTHSVDTACFINGAYYKFGGFIWTSQGGQVGSWGWKYDPVTNAWTKLAQMPWSAAGMVFGDATQNKIFVQDNYDGSAGSPNFKYAFYRVGANTFSASKNASFAAPLYWSTAYDPTRSRCLGFGVGDARFGTVDWTNETITWGSSLSVTGSTARSRQGPFLFYDQTADCYWAFGGGSYSTIEQINASTGALIASNTLTGASIPLMTNFRGDWGRAVLLKWGSTRAIGFCTTNSNPAMVVKLP